MKMWSWQAIILAANLLIVAHDVNTQTILAGPRDTSGVSGTDQRLACTVNGVSSLTVVLWEVPRGSILINHEAAIPSEYGNRFSTETETINDAANEYTFTLVIHNLDDNDGGEYKCKVLFDSNIVAEVSADVYVMSPSSDGRPSCFANPSGELVENEIVTLTCISSSPTADLVWRSEGNHLPTTSSTKYAPSTSELSFSANDDGRRYSCVSISLLSECNLVLSVQYPPKVEITPTTEDVELDKSVGFSCEATGNPSVFTYTWFYSGSLITDSGRTNGFQLDNNGKLLTLPDVDPNDNGVTLTCQVTNEVGEGEDEYFIATVEGKSTVEIVGPILVTIVLFIILVILIAFTTWYCRQKKTIKKIKKKELIRRAESARRKRQTGSVIIPMRQTNSLRGNTNVGYLPDINPRENDEDDDRLRPIPRRKSETSSIGKKGSVESSMSDYIVQDMPTTEEEDPSDASYVYQVNPHITDFNSKKGSYTVNIDLDDPSLPSEVDSTEDIDSIIPSTDL